MESSREEVEVGLPLIITSNRAKRAISTGIRDRLPPPTRRLLDRQTTQLRLECFQTGRE